MGPGYVVDIFPGSTAHPYPDPVELVGLVEREPQLELVRDAIDRSTVDGGVLCVVGEAGAGKTALVRSATSTPSGTRVTRGLCDPLTTPRPLGPIRDVLLDLTGRAEEHPTPSEQAAAFLSAVGSEPTVVVVEDAQWVDAASVEVLRFVVRRIETVPVALVLTYRDAEVGAQHVLRPLLGDLARLESATKVQLPGLTVAGIRALLAGTGLDPAEVLARTGGNPFFVTEIARHPEEGVPASVRDAVLASAARVGPVDLEALQLLATAPDAVDDRLLPALGVDVPQLRRLEDTGLLVRTRRGVAFRHELARLAVEASVPPGVSRMLHHRLLVALESTGLGDSATLAHHADAAGDVERTVRHADRAADEASRAGSHTEARAFLRLALARVGDDAALRADLLERLSFECYMVSRLDEAVDAVVEATRLRRRVGDRDGVAAAHTHRALFEYYRAHRRVAQHHVELAAVDPSSRSYGSAKSLEELLEFRRNNVEAAAKAAVEARAVADRQGDEQLRLRVDLLAEAAGMLGEDPVPARERALTLVTEAAAAEFDETASTGWSQVSALDVEHRRFREAEALLSVSLPFTVDRDIPICNQWQTGVRSRLHLYRGRWEAALEDARAVLDGGAPVASLWPNLVIALVALRRGSGDTQDADRLDQAWELAEEVDEPLALLAAASAVAEQAWLRDGWDERLDTAAVLLDRVDGLPGVEWAVGELAVWLARLGRRPAPRSVAEPHAHELAGRAGEAARCWRTLGAPYEQALAALGSDDEDEAAGAVESIEAMGARASAERARADLRSRGWNRVPVRPRPSTLANPAGLTNRQLEVARLVARGLTNAELAQELYISPRTADHHVAAVLAKLGLESRRDVIRRAEELGLA